MKRYLTEYLSGGSLFGAHIWAKNKKEAESICILRNIGERVLFESTPRKNEKLPKSKEGILHEACFLSFVCLSAGILTIDQAIGDEGIVHQIAHHISIDSEEEEYPIPKVKIDWLRRVTPGYLKC